MKKKDTTWFTDRNVVLFFAVVDLLLILVARSYFNSLNSLAVRNIANSSVEREDEAIAELEKVAKQGSWENFEKVRSEGATYYLQSHSRPSLDRALYFYPETLPDESFEREFVERDLKPGVNDLKQAYQSKKPLETRGAFQRLKARVENYERGAHAEPGSLSEDGKRFLKLYEELTRLVGDHPSPQIPIDLPRKNR